MKKKQFTLGMTADKTELNLAETLKGMCFSSGVVNRHDLEDRGRSMVRHLGISLRMEEHQ